MPDELKDTEVKETENVEIDGEQYQVNTLKSGTIEIEIPEDLDEAGREEFVSAIREKSKTVGSYYKKLAELNQEKQNPAWLKFKEAYEKGEIDQNDTPPEGKTTETPADDQLKEKKLWEDLGLENAEDLQDYIIDHPIEYARALEARHRRSIQSTVAEELAKRQQESDQKAAEVALEMRITDAGHDPKEVKAYAKFTGIPFGERAFQLYQAERAPKTDPAIEARLKAQEEQVTFTNRGSRNATTQTNTDVKQLSPEQLAARKEHFMKQARGY